MRVFDDGQKNSYLKMELFFNGNIMSTWPGVNVMTVVPKSILDLIWNDLTNVLLSSQVWIDVYSGEHRLCFALIASWCVLIF